MRLRVQTAGDLPDFKAWYATENAPALKKVSDLKSVLCQQLPPLKSLGLSGNQLILLLDGFELLDESSINVVRDGDLISIQLAPDTWLEELRGASQSKDLKRKREVSPPPVPRPHVPQIHTKIKPTWKKAALSSSSSSSSSSSESDSDSDSSSSSSPSSSSSSSSDSSTSDESSSDDEPPQVISSKRGKPTAGSSQKLKKPLETFIPPGHGKPSTKLRNIRRRLKRQHDKARQTEELTASAPKTLSAANSLQLGAATNTTSDTLLGGDILMQENATVLESEIVAGPQIPDELMMTFMGNKNKKKGFKQSMARPLPPKIVFNDSTGDTPPTPVSKATISSTQMSEQGQTATPMPRLIPPSEKQERGELPPRLFVTSIDVEGDIARGKRKGKKARTEEFWEEPVVDEFMYEESRMDADAVAEELVEEEAEEGPSFDWERAEREWASFGEVKDASQLVDKVLVGWKSLALNPLTCSPEFMLSVGAITRPFNSARGKVAIQLIPRPTPTNSISYGIGEDLELAEEYSWDEVQSSRWRIISLQ